MGDRTLSWALVLFLGLVFTLALTLALTLFLQVLQTIERIFLFCFYPGDACSQINAIGLQADRDRFNGVAYLSDYRRILQTGFKQRLDDRRWCIMNIF